MTTVAIDIVKDNLKNHLASMAACPSVAPKEHQWIYWVFSYLYKGKDMKEEDRRTKVTNLFSLADDVLASQQIDLVCLRCFSSIQQYQEYDVKFPGRLFQVNDNPIGYTDTVREDCGEDQAVIMLLLTNVLNAVRLGFGIPGWADPFTQALQHVVKKDAKKDTSSHLWLSFSLQMVLDIRRVLKEHESDAFYECQVNGKRVTQLIRNHFKSPPKDPSALEKKAYDYMGSKMLEFSKFIAIWGKSFIAPIFMSMVLG